MGHQARPNQIVGPVENLVVVAVAEVDKVEEGTEAQKVWAVEGHPNRILGSAETTWPAHSRTANSCTIHMIRSRLRIKSELE